MVILSLVVGGAGVLMYTLRSPNSPTIPSAQQTVISESKHVRTEESETMSIDVAYPMINESLPGAKQANKEIEDELNLQISQFEKEATSLDYSVTLPKTVKSYVDGGYLVEFENDRVLSLSFGAEWYIRGAAHPYHTVHTFIFDKKLGKIVAGQDLFKASSKYLEYLSAYAYKDLVQQAKEGDVDFSYDDDTIKSGTQAALENFKHVLPIQEGLAIYFDEYQVAPYAAGSQQVVIPYEKLKDYAEPSSIIGELAK